MNKIKLAINGFGRIGRLTFKYLLDNPTIDVVAINDLSDTPTLLHLLKYDTLYGSMNGRISQQGSNIQYDGRQIRMISEENPVKLPWKELGVDLVFECTGKFRTREECITHLHAGAKQVVLSAPPKTNDIPIVVLGVNDNLLDEEHPVLSNASCTTNCLAPMMKVLHDTYRVKEAFVTTVHAYTADQNLVDAPHKDLRRARAAAMNIIPTTTGAADATTHILPHLKNRIRANAYRVPLAGGSLTDVTCLLEHTPGAGQLNRTFKKAAEGFLNGLMSYATDPLVSSDIIGDTHSCIFDSLLTEVEDQMVKVVGWYDNEAGYSTRLANLASRISTTAVY